MTKHYNGSCPIKNVKKIAIPGKLHCVIPDMAIVIYGSIKLVFEL